MTRRRRRHLRCFFCIMVSLDHIMKKMMIKGFLALALLAGCGKKETGYTRITSEEAQKMMEQEEGYVIVDVRRTDEYEEGHIPDAVCIPLDTIETEASSLLKDQNQLILVYCRSGRRSKEASEKLAGMGYVNVYEFGGINDWKGEIVTETLYNYTKEPGCSLIVEVNGIQLMGSIGGNPASDELKKKLKEEGPIEVELSEYGGFERVGDLPWSLPREDERITGEPGDILLYQGKQMTIFYGQNTWEYTRLAKLIGYTAEELKEAFGEGDVTVRLFLDWWDY